MCLAVVKNLGVWFDANFSLADNVHNMQKTRFIQICDLRRVKQYRTDQAATLAANALRSSHPDYCYSLFRSLSSFNMPNCSESRRHLLGLSKTVINTYWHLAFSKNSIGCQLNNTTSLKQPWFISCFPVFISAILVLICLFFVKDMAQGTTIQIKGFCSFLSSTYLHIKKRFGHSFAFDAPTVWNDFPEDVCSAPTLARFRKKI